MPTLDNLVRRVEREHRKNGSVPPDKHIIRQDLVDGIKFIEQGIVMDAMKELLTYKDTTMAGESTIPYPDRYGRFVSMKAEESDGKFGFPYSFVTRDVFDERKRLEDEGEFDTTSTRIVTIGAIEDAASLTPAFEIYPTPVSGRDVRLTFIQASSVTGTITLPIILHLALIYFASGQMDNFYTEFNRINRTYFNREGLSPSVVGIVGELY